MKTVNVVTIRNNIVDELMAYPDNREGNLLAEKHFMYQMSQCLSNFDEYSESNIESCLDDGYCGFGTGSICITHNENNEED